MEQSRIEALANFSANSAVSALSPFVPMHLMFDGSGYSAAFFKEFKEYFDFNEIPT